MAKPLNPTGQALYAAICAQPHDDDLRLVYSDWLEEHDQPDRAEAIRLDVRRRDLDDLDPEAWVIDTRLSHLCDQFHEDWLAELPELDGVDWHYGNGLTAGASVDSAQALLDHGKTIFTAAPVTSLRAFVITIPGGEPIRETPELFARCQHLDRVRTLHLDGMAPPEVFGIDRLARLPGLAGLRELHLAEGGHEDDLLEHLALCPAWPSLQVLNLYRGWYEAPGLRALARGPILASLRSLNVSRSGGMQDAGLRELLRSPHLAGLRRLELSECSLKSRVMKALAEYPWEGLDRLDLSSNDLTAAGVRHLAGAPRLAALRSLDLSANHNLGDDGMKALAQSPHLRNLCDLDLGFWTLSRRGVSALAGASWLRQLRRLRLCSLDTRRAGLEILAAAPLDGLRALDLGHSDLTADDLPALLAAPWLSGLTHLNLSSNNLGEAGANLLAAAPGLDNLVELDLHRNEIPATAGDRLRGRFGDRVIVKASWEK